MVLGPLGRDGPLEYETPEARRLNSGYPLKDPKSRTADFVVRLMAMTAEHVRDCRRCYEILVRRVGEKLDELATMDGEKITEAPITSIQRAMARAARTGAPIIILAPSELWPLLSELYPAFVTCEHWPKVEVPI